MEEVVDSLKQQLELSFHFLLFQSYYWTSVCEIFDPSNIQYFTFEMKHPVREHLCMYTHGWPVTLFQNSRSSPLFLNNANFYSQSRFVGMESSSSVPSTLYTNVQGEKRDGFAFSFRLFPEILFPLPIEVNV